MTSVRPEIICENVTKSYRNWRWLQGGAKEYLVRWWKVRDKIMESSREPVLRDLTFSISSGESLGVVGRNGAGKSTLLALMGGVLRPDSGRITVHGRVLPLLEIGAGLHPDLTGRENIRLNGMLLGMKRAEIIHRADQIIDFSGLGARIDDPVRTYSTGMRARLGFSIAVHSEGDILLIDEVLAVGDKDFREKCQDKITGFRRSGKIIVLVSHNTPDIEKYCDKVLWLEGGVVHMFGTTETVMSAYNGG